MFALLRLNYQRFVALEAALRADSDRRIDEALSEKQAQAAGWLMQRDTQISEVSAGYEAANQSLRMQVASRDAEISKLRQRLAPFVELQPLIVRSVELDGYFIRVEIENPNGRPVKDCQLRLVSVYRVSAADPSAPLPPSGFVFTRSSHEGAALTFPVPTGLPVHVDVAAALPMAAWGLLYFLTLSHENPDVPIGTRFPQATGIFELDVEAGSHSEAIAPARVRVLITFDRGKGFLSASLLPLVPQPPNDQDSHQQLSNDLVSENLD